MAQYKCVPGPGVLGIRRLEQLKEAVGSYGEIITQETIGGWQLHAIYPIQITKKVGLLGKALAGLSDDNYEVNMLVFRKDE